MILLTGGLGFIGTHTTRALLDLGEDCLLGQRRTGPVPDFLPAAPGGRLAIEALDCTDATALHDTCRRHGITGIVHLAGAPLGGHPPIDELWTNLEGLFAVLRTARELGIGRVVLASTIGVYGGLDVDVYREDAPLPVAGAIPLAAYKKSAEILTGAVTDGPELINVRIGAIWGPLGRPSSFFFGAPQLIHAAATASVGDPPYGEDAVDMCYVRDCGRAIGLLLTAPSLRHHTYNIGSGTTTTNGEVADAIGRVVSGPAPAVTPGRSPHAPPRDAYLDITRLRTDTGYAPEYDLDGAVADYLAWLRAGHPR